MDLNRAE